MAFFARGEPLANSGPASLGADIKQGASEAGETLKEGAVVYFALERKELIRPEEASFAGETAFRFGHILIRDAAYQGIPKAERADLHERFGAWLQRAA